MEGKVTQPVAVHLIQEENEAKLLMAAVQPITKNLIQSFDPMATHTSLINPLEAKVSTQT